MYHLWLLKKVLFLNYFAKHVDRNLLPYKGIENIREREKRLKCILPVSEKTTDEKECENLNILYVQIDFCF